MVKPLYIPADVGWCYCHCRFVDDTFIIIQRSQKDNFLQHLNAIDDNIHFTCEEADEDGSIAFLDVLITPAEDGRLNTSVYKKATHTDQYLHWDSHHAITSKYSVVGTLFYRARTICSNPRQLQREEKHLYQSLRKCKYPDWAINRMKLKSQSSALKRKATTTTLSQATSELQSLTLWSLTIKDWVKAIRTFARSMGLKYILKEVIPSKTF